MQIILGVKKWRVCRVVISASIAFVCSCGGRPDLETINQTSVEQTPVKQIPAWNCQDDSNTVEAFGCVLRASDVNGADIGPTPLTIVESPPAGPRSINGYWLRGFDFVIVGKDGIGRWFQLRSSNLNLNALDCDKSLPLVPHAAQDGVMLRWAATATDFWVSNSGALDIVAFEHNGSTGYAPIQFALDGVPMAVPGPTEPGSATNNATGTFTASVSCRLKKFKYIAPN